MAIYRPSIFSDLLSFSGSSFFGLDELHLIARGIGRLVYDLVMVDISKNDIAYYTNADGSQNTIDYPFYINKNVLKDIGQTIVASRSSIPVSFQGSFDNIIAKIEGTRHVDWLDFLLYIVPTLVVPELPLASQAPLLALVKGCQLALQWDLTESLLVEMEG
jgi:hypothetical protein